MPCSCLDWDKTDPLPPNTKKSATPTRYEKVHGVTAIEVNNATYRNCKPISGVFEMVSPDRDPRHHKNGIRVEVFCCWYGAKSKSKFPNICVKRGKFKIINNYEGQVIRNIS